MDDIGILAGGRLRAQGSPLYLKSRFGKGFEVWLSVTPPEETPRVLEEVKRMLPGVVRAFPYRGGYHVFPNLVIYLPYLVMHFPSSGAEVLRNAAGSVTVGLSKGLVHLLPGFFRHLDRGN